MRRGKVRIVASGALSLAVFAYAIHDVTPALACNPSRSNNGQFYYDAFKAYNLGTIGGVYSTNLVFTPYTVQNTYTTVYDRIDNTSNPGSLKAWIAWVYYGVSGSISTQAGWHDAANCSGGVCMYQSVGIDSPGQHNTYEVLYNNCASGSISVSDNGSNQLFVPTCEAIDFTPNEATISGAMSTLADQMPGGYNNVETLNGANEYSNGSWHSFYNNAVQTDNGQYGGGDYFGYGVPTVYNGYIYDAACAS